MLATNICLYVRLMLWLLECEKHMIIFKNLRTSLKSGLSVFYVETLKAYMYKVSEYLIEFVPRTITHFV